MNRRIKGLFDIVLLRAVGRMVMATCVMSIISYISVQLLQLQNTDQSFFATFPKFVAIVTISASAYLLMSKLLHLNEAAPVLSRIKKILFVRARLGK